MTSSTKPEVQNGCVAFMLCEQTDKQTDRLITILYTPPKGKIKISNCIISPN